MSKTWIKCEKQEWINLEHAKWVFVERDRHREGIWDIYVDFMKPEEPTHVIASHQTEQSAHQMMDDIMSRLRLER